MRSQAQIVKITDIPQPPYPSSYLNPEEKVSSHVLESYPVMIGDSKVMQNLRQLIERLRNHNNSPIIIYGETGTGKELVARYLTPLNTPFVAVNCGGLPHYILASELFGHKKGAFTDAVSDHQGLFEQANDGTLFLDEISELPMEIQPIFLRALQEKEVKQLGGNNTVKVNTRVISATNKNLEELVKTREFREDLFYRLNGVPVYVPPLRERRDDIPKLVDYFITRYEEEHPGKHIYYTPRFLNAVLMYDWPGNVRQLENELMRHIVLGLFFNNRIIIEEFSINQNSVCSGVQQDQLPKLDENNSRFREVDELLLIRAVLNETYYHIGNASKKLNMSRTTLWRKIKRYGITSKRDHSPNLISSEEQKICSEKQLSADLIRSILHKTNFNRGRTAEILGISRTTLWRKMRQYGICI